MQTIIHKSATRGHANHGWLDSHHTFSFANYYDPERVHFGNLRVLNDDIVAPAMGFGKHPHDNMEIISIPLTGSLMHEDSMGHKQVIGENEVQVMSAGTGIYHSEYNASKTDPVNFLQLWILPEEKNIKPVHNQKFFAPGEAQNQWQVLVDQRNGPLKVNQKATVSRVFLEKGKELDYHFNNQSFGSYLFLIEGNIQIDDIELKKRDGMGIENNSMFTIKALEKSTLINIEI